jgi:opacity protein-like surface antigen
MKNLNTIPVITTLTILVSLVISGDDLSAQTRHKTGTTAVSFLEIGIGSRAVALGEAYVAIAEGPTAGYWNPAGLGWMTRPEISVMHLDWVADIDMQNVAFALPIPNVFTLGFMVTNLGIPDDKVRTVEDPEGLSGEIFNANSIALSMQVSKQFTDRFSVGLGFKYINESILNESANAVALDMGVLVRTDVLNNMTLGMSISNFGSEFKFGGTDLERAIAARPDILGTNQSVPGEFSTTSFSLPLIFRVGVAMNIFENNAHKLLFSAEGLHPNNTSEYVNVGGEYVITSFRKIGEFALRGGYNALFMEDSQQGLNLGAGLSLYVSEKFSLAIDYAYSDFEFFGSLHRYTVNFKF